MRPSTISSILRTTAGEALPVRVTGAPIAARALIVSRFVKFHEKSAVVLCPDDDSAAEFALSIEAIASAIDGSSPEVCLLPTWEQSAYSPISLSIRTRHLRAATLAKACSPIAGTEGQNRVFVASLAAAAQATLPREVFLRHSINLTIDAITDRGSLIQRLQDAGYLRSDSVEDPGTFAVRGEILDVFPPDRPRPLRIELFDDQLEKIREFDPASQRTLASDRPIRSVSIPPAREVLLNEGTTPQARERLKRFADDHDVPRSVRDPVLASVQSGLYSERSDAWAAFAYDIPTTFWDYARQPDGTPWPVIWSDSFGCIEKWDAFYKEQDRLFQKSSEAGIIVPRPSDLFPWDQKKREVLQRPGLMLEQLEITAPEATPATRLEVEIQRNTDLTAARQNRRSRHSLGELEIQFRGWLKEGFRIFVLASTQSQQERLKFLFEERGLPCRTSDSSGHDGPGVSSGSPDSGTTGVILLRTGSIPEGFRWTSEGLVVTTDHEIFGGSPAKQRTPRTSESGSAAQEWSGLSALSDLAVGDAVVHIDHGIGLYKGLVRLELSGAPSDFLLLEYANRDRLYLPVYRMNLIQRYVGAGENAPLDKLGKQDFQKTKDKVREAVRKLAIDLVQLYAERKIREGIRFSARDSLLREFEAKFPFDETPDQLRAIDDILADLGSGKVTDRLVCGDVGYGKTEVAMRAAFRVAIDGKQVAVLVPTTVLAYQHEQSFKTRFADYPITIESLSRFKSAREQKETLQRLAEGKTDIVVGTHRLLSKDIRFKSLGLVIVDEEHRFGVEHKERLKTLKVNTHVLTLTATPIPRTLHMALSGLRDISLMNTPPVDRLPIKTFVSRFDDELIRRAIEFELSRGGQVFFLHNRVQTIEKLASRIRELVPGALVTVGHGQMAEGALEKTMLGFYQKKFNVLVCTTIIESGLDLPSANTIIIDRADSMGLAQLYQLRGRVGRGQERAYAYLLLPEEGAISGDAKRRLEVIQRFVELGSGFAVANHDLEIRGGGDLLGPQQSGHIAAVGFDLYTELLEEAMRELRGKPIEPEESRREPEIKVPFPAFLSETYVPDVHQRLAIYRRFSSAAHESDIERLEEELVDRFGTLPPEAQNLLWLIRIKQLLKRAGIDSLTAGKERVSLQSGPESRLDPARAVALVASDGGRFQLLPDSRFVAKIEARSLSDLYFALEKLLERLGAG